MTRPTTEQITHETRLLSDVLSGIVTPEAFGAKGDGVTNDTAALQAALDTLKEVRGSPGKTYLVRRVSGTRRCLLWKSGMRWVGCGSVIKLADGEYVASVGCSVIMTEGTDQSPGTVTSNTSFVGAIDGNSVNQGAVIFGSTWLTPTVYANNIERTHWDLTITNAHVYGFYASGSNQDNTLSASVYGSRGNGVSLYGARWNVPYIYARDIISNGFVGNQGGPFTVAITDSTIGRVSAENFGAGIKLQGDTTNVNVDSIIALGGAQTSGTKSRAVRFQGDGPNGLRNISVGNILSEGFEVGGLYIFNCDNITIDSYIGRNNGSNPAESFANRLDTYIVASNEVSLLSVTIDGCGSHPIFTSGDSNNVHVGHLVCINTPNNTALWGNSSGSSGNVTNVTFGTIAVRNETAGWASRINDGAGFANAYIGQVSIDVPFSNYTGASLTPIVMGNGAGFIRTGPITFRNVATSGLVRLDNNSTTTAVPNAPAMVASNGINCAPIIKVEPVSNNNNNNSSVLQAGLFTASAGNQSTGGITIRHPAIPAVGTLYARWTIEGYQAPGDCLEATSATSLIVMGSATAAQIADQTNSVNLGSKHAGQLVWDTTNNRLLRSSGTTDVSPWHVVDGSATVTPS
jgi:hypothetical protein